MPNGKIIADHRDCGILSVNEQSGVSVGIRNPPAESGEGFCWRAWPCAACSRGCTPIRHIRRSIQAGAALPEDIHHPEQVAASQSRCILEWVQTCPHTTWNLDRFPNLAEGSEHIVFFDAAETRVWKLTRPAVFGDSYYLVNELIHQKNDSPREYLVRLRLWKSVFQSAPIACGVTEAGQIVSRHLFIAGVLPSQEEVDVFLADTGLTPRKQRLWLWKRSYPKLDIWVGDARSDNFVKSIEGVVQSICVCGSRRRRCDERSRDV
ncbi:MAG TPA: hypothetical protein VM680_00675 [Verrucomicrobiae bacterium]|nr:hypothetical protein [Verrucomicrobiae bacterium]